MCDEFIHPGLVEDPRVSRRTFGLIAGAAAMSAAGGALAKTAVVERDVEVKTPDGSCDAVLFCPDKPGKWPAVLIWTDILGLRPVFRDMGHKLAAQGYVVLAPNPFYRSKHAPLFEGPVDFDKADQSQRNLLFGLAGTLTPQAVTADSKAYLAFLDAQPQTDTSKKAGVQGYCLGGLFSIRTAAAAPNRIAAVAMFHAGNTIATDKPDSPHLLIPQTRAAYLIGQAQNDDAQQPQIKETLKAAFAAAGRPATVEVYPANHGWCVKGNGTYDEPSAERAWTELFKLYETTLL